MNMKELMDLLQEAGAKKSDKRLFKQLPGTNYWYRKDADNRLDDINSVLESPIIEELSLSKADSNLLEEFYKNNIKGTRPQARTFSEL